MQQNAKVRSLVLTSIFNGDFGGSRVGIPRDVSIMAQTVAGFCEASKSGTLWRNELKSKEPLSLAN